MENSSHMGRLGGAVGILLIALLIGAPVSAAQMDPASPPLRDGPITMSNESYEGEHCSKRTFDVAATSKTCRYFYRYDSSDETDADNDYGMWWFQVRIKPRPGWCLVEAKTSIATEGTIIHGVSDKRRKVKASTEIGNKLAGDAGGNASAASVKNRFTVRKGRFASYFRNDTSVMKLRWVGRETKKTVALAGGFEGAWPSAGAPPPFTLSGGPSFTEC